MRRTVGKKQRGTGVRLTSEPRHLRISSLLSSQNKYSSQVSVSQLRIVD